MVAAKDYHQEPSMVLKYSCDEGYSWSDFTFIDVRLTTVSLSMCVYAKQSEQVARMQILCLHIMYIMIRIILGFSWPSLRS